MPTLFHYQDSDGRWRVQPLPRRPGEAEPSPPPVSTWVAGLDLGQTGDYSAWALVERPPVGDGTPASYRVRDLRRWPLGTSYVAIVADVLARMGQAPLAPAGMLVIDQTGVGRAVFDLFAAGQLGARLTGVTITSGAAATRAGPQEWHTPKVELIGQLQVVLQSQRLQVADRLPEAATLKKELGTYQRRFTPSANVQFGQWREGQHDDVLLAVAVAIWYAERGVSTPQLFVF